MRKPNFFIVGAPKCGTTALTEYLRCHPQVFMAWPKEPHYFAEDFARFRRVRSAEEYFDIFQGAKNSHVAIGEASVWYLYSSVAIERMYQFDPQTKLVIMLRDPLDFVRSLHNQLLYSFFETEEDFARAWALQEDRENGKRIPRTCLEPSFLLYKRVARFGEQLRRVYRVFAPDQIKVILLEDFARSTREVYVEVLDFLGVAPHEQQAFPRVNVRKRHRSRMLGRLLISPPPLVRFGERQAKNLLRALGIRNFSAWHRLIRLNERPAEFGPINDDLHLELIDAFTNDVQCLGQLIGRDLSHWLSPARRAGLPLVGLRAGCR
jgi:hypothetical protein